MIIDQLSIEDKIRFYEKQLDNISKEPFESWFININSSIINVNKENRDAVIEELKKVIYNLKKDTILI